MKNFTNRFYKYYFLLIILCFTSFFCCTNSQVNILDLHNVNGFSKRSYFIEDNNYINIVLQTYSKVGLDGEENLYKLNISIPDYSKFGLKTKILMNSNENINCSFSFDNSTYFNFVGYFVINEKTDSTLNIKLDINPIKTIKKGEIKTLNLYYNGEIILKRNEIKKKI